MNLQESQKKAEERFGMVDHQLDESRDEEAIDEAIQERNYDHAMDQMI